MNDVLISHDYNIRSYYASVSLSCMNLILLQIAIVFRSLSNDLRQTENHQVFAFLKNYYLLLL